MHVGGQLFQILWSGITRFSVRGASLLCLCLSLTACIENGEPEFSELASISLDPIVFNPASITIYDVNEDFVISGSADRLTQKIEVSWDDGLQWRDLSELASSDSDLNFLDKTFSIKISDAQSLISTLSNGTDSSHNLILKTTSILGDTETGTFTLHYSASGQPADTQIAGQPTGTANTTVLNITVSGANVVEYSFKVGESSSTDCSVASGYLSAVNVSTPITSDISGLSDGGIRLCVIGKNAQNVWEDYSSAAQADWTKDTSAPSATLSGAPTGSSNVTTLNVTVGGTDVASYRYKIGASGSTDCSSSSGYSSDTAVGTPITHDISGLAEGTLRLCVVGKDAVGNEQAHSSSTSTTWIKDTLAPTATLSGVPTDPSNTTLLNINVSGAGVSDYRYKIGEAGSTDCTSASGYGPEVAEGLNITDDISGLSEGSVKVCVIGRDIAGNFQDLSSATQATWTKDTQAPMPVLSGLPANPSNITALSVNVGGTGLLFYQYKLGEDSNTDCALSSGYSADIAESTDITADFSGLSDGLLKLCVVGRDAAGNLLSYASAETHTWVKDTAAPSATLSGAPTGVNNATALSVNVGGTGVIAYHYKLGASGSMDCSIATGYVLDVTESTDITDDISGLGDGNITLCVVGKDSAGNQQNFSSATQATWTKDTSPPDAVLAGLPSNPSGLTTLAIDVGGAGVTAYRYKVGPAASLDCSLSSGYGTEVMESLNITDDISGLGDGSVEVCVIGKDSAGNWEPFAQAASFTWTKDTQAPDAVLSNLPSSPGNTTVLDVNVGGADVIAYQFKVGLNSIDCASVSDYSADIPESTNITTDISGLADGTIKLCVVGKDSAGNLKDYSGAEVHTWIKDTSAPAAVLSGQPTGTNSVTNVNITVSGADVTHYRYKIGSGTQDCSGGYGSETLVGTAISEDISGFPDGNIYVCVIGRDTAGNYQLPGSATTAAWTKLVSPPTLTQFAILGPTSVPAGECVPYKVERQDQYGSPMSEPFSTSLTLSVSAGGDFYADSSCLLSISSTSIASFSAEKTVYYKDPSSGNSATLTASNGSLTDGSLNVSSHTPAPGELALLTEDNLPTQTCVPLTVERRDQTGYPHATVDWTDVSVSFDGSVEYYLDSVCLLGTSSTFTIQPWETSKTKYIRITSSPNTYQFDASDLAIQYSDTNKTITAYDASTPKWKILLSQSKYAINTCHSGQIQRVDQFGQPFPGPTNVSPTLDDSSSNLNFYKDPNCMDLGPVNLPSESTSAFFYFMGFSDGPTEINANGTYNPATPVPVELYTPGPGQWRLSFDSINFPMGGCRPGIVERLDQFGYPFQQGTIETPSVTDAPDHVDIFSDSDCTQVGPVSIGATQTQATFYVYSHTLGSGDLIANALNGYAASDPVPFNVYTPAAGSWKIHLSQSEYSTMKCHQGRIERLDTNGNPHYAPYDDYVSFDDTQFLVNFYKDPECSDSNDVRVRSGDSDAYFYFMALSTGNTEFQATGGTPTMSLAAPAEFYTPTAGPLSIQLSAAQFAHGRCFTGTIIRKDQFGHPYSDPNPLSTLLSDAGTLLSFYKSQDCSGTPGSPQFGSEDSEAPFSFFTSSTGWTDLTVSGSPFIEGYFNNVEIYTASEGKWKIELSQSEYSRSGCHEATLIRLDQNGFPFQGTTASANLSGSGATFYSDSQCSVSSPINFNSNESAKSFYFIPNTLGLHSMDASGSPFSSSDPVSVEYYDAVSGQSEWVLHFDHDEYPINQCQKGVIRRVDQFGHPYPGAADDVSVDGSPAGFFRDSNCTDSSDVHFEVGETEQDFYFFSASSINNVLVTTSGGFIMPAMPVEIDFYTQSQGEWKVVLTRGHYATEGCYEGTLQRLDQNGFLYFEPSSRSTSISVTSADLFSDPNCTASASSFTVPASAASTKFYFSPVTALDTEFIANSGSGYGASDPVDVTFYDAIQGEWGFDLAQQEFATDQCHKGTLYRLDQYGEPFAETTQRTANLSDDGGVVQFSTSSDCTGSSGNLVLNLLPLQSSRNFYFKTGSSIATNLQANGSPYAPTSKSVEFYSPNAEQWRIVLANSEYPTGQCHEGWVERIDQNGHPAFVNTVHNATLAGSASFFYDSNCSNSTSSIPIAPQASGSKFYFKSSSSGFDYFSATGSALNPSFTVEVEFYLPTAGTLEIAGVTNAPQNACFPLTLQRLDDRGQPFPDSVSISVNLNRSLGSGDFYLNSSCTVTTSSQAIYENEWQRTVYYKSGTLGTERIYVSSTGYTPSPDRDIEIYSPTIGFIKFQVSEEAPVDSCVKIEVERYDQYGFPYAPGTSTPLSYGYSGSGDFYPTSDCSGPPETSFSIASNKSHTVFYLKEPFAGEQMLTVDDGAGGYGDPAPVSVNFYSPIEGSLSLQAFGKMKLSACSPVIISRRDMKGELMPVGFQTDINISLSGMGDVYQNSDCTGLISTTQIPAGNHTVTVYVNATGTGALSLQVLDQGGTFDPSPYHNADVTQCAPGYIPVPGSHAFPLDDFCVAKYEMRNGSPAQSIPTGTPWTNIDMFNAMNACRSIGSGYDLISPYHWTILARNIEMVAVNWSGGVVGSGALNQGHSQNSPATACESTHEYLSGSCSSPGTATHAKKRTHTLSNGEIIWDLSGNVEEWVLSDTHEVFGANNYMSVISDPAGNYPDITRYIFAPIGDHSLASSPPYAGLGFANLSNPQGGMIRGGAFNSGDLAGVFRVHTLISLSSVNSVIGFRCYQQ